MNQTVSIIIPNWNGQELLANNLPPVLEAARQLGPRFQECIVVDDASTDTSTEFLERTFPEITIIRLAKNCGFITAVNTGVHHAHGDIVLILNTDMVPHPDAFTKLITPFTDPELFGVSGSILSADKTTFLYGNRGGYFKRGHFYLYEKDRSALSQSLFVCGGAGAFSRKKFLELNGFDTLYTPLYYEEQDLSYRALKRGWHVRYEPESIMYHQIRGSILKKISVRKLSYISARNNYLFVIKNITDPYYTLQSLIFVPLFILKDLCLLKPRFLIAFLLALPRIPRALVARFRQRRWAFYSDRDILGRVNEPA